MAAPDRTTLPSSRTADLVGVALVTASAFWIGLAAGEGAGRPFPVLALIGATTASFVVGRWVADREALTVHRLVGVAVGGALLLTAPGLVHAGGAPLGYANANATVAGLGALATLGVATAERGARSAAWWGLAAALALSVLLTASAAGASSLVVSVGLLAVSATARRPSATLLGGAIAVALALGATAAIAHGADLWDLRDRADERAELWAAATDLVAEHPLRGVGPGSFATANPVSNDDDLRWAHQEYLQLAAETGVVGLTLVLAVLAWVYLRLGLAAVASPHRASLGGAAVTLVALHATVDHVMHHPAVVLTLAVMVGAATSRSKRAPGTLGSRRPQR